MSNLFSAHSTGKSLYPCEQFQGNSRPCPCLLSYFWFDLIISLVGLSCNSASCDFLQQSHVLTEGHRLPWFPCLSLQVPDGRRSALVAGQSNTAVPLPAAPWAVCAWEVHQNMGGRLTHWLLVCQKSIKILEVSLHLCWCIDHQNMGGRCYTLAVGASEVHQNIRGRLTSWLLVHRKSIKMWE